MTKEQFFGMYIGQKVKHTISDDCVLLESAIDHTHVCVDKRIKIKLSMYDCKLILRPFESMTDEEWICCFKKIHHSIQSIEKVGKFIRVKFDEGCECGYEIPCDIPFDCIEYLISIGIDVFNLKGRGWAVYEERSET